MNANVENMPQELVLHCPDEDATRSVGRALGRALVPGLTILLWGDLGSGKTVLVRGVGDALGAKHVRSPSFTLVNEYHTKIEKIFIVHADLYRLDSDGVDALGLDEYLANGETGDTVLFVEWPERWANPPVRNVLSVKFRSPDETSRVLTFSGTGIAEGVIKSMANAVNQEVMGRD